MKKNTIISQLAYEDKEGSLRFKGVRYLLIRPETLASVQMALENEVGRERAGEILAAGGITGGRLSGRKYKQAFGLEDRQAIEYMCQMGGEIGWGRFRFVELDQQAPRLVVEVDHSPFAEFSGRRASQGVCHLIRGVLAGLANAIFGEEVEARETRCLACGDACCRFEVQGKSSQDI